MPNALFNSNLTLPATLTTIPVPPQLQTELCAGDRPLALLPVRLETRFFLQPDASYELRVRVYPDKIHIDSHETELTPSEREWGEHFWEQHWRAGKQPDAELGAWRQLADRFDAARAGWIARALRPANPQDRPSTPVAPGQALPKPIVFPTVAVTSGENQHASWRHAPIARLLPDQWIAVGYSAGQVAVTATSKPIRRPLAVGPDPQSAAIDDGSETSLDNDSVAVDDGMRWMIDFDSAEAAGMALRLKVSAQLAASGIDTLLVLGAATSLPAAEAASQLGKLLDAHHYTDGLSFLSVGVPTNNTEEARSGYGEHDSGRQISFAAEMSGSETLADADSNARQLGAALGLPADRMADVLGRMPGAARRQSLDLRAMNTALWPGTWGYFLSNLIGLEGTGLTQDILTWAREHFVAHVRSLGPFAAMRCGRQPYGILPVTSLDFWRPSPDEPAQHTRDAGLRGLLIELRDKVWRARVGNVPRVGRTHQPAADLAEVMRTEGQSNSYATRSLLGNHYLLHLRALMLEDLEAHAWVTTQEALTAPILQSLGIPWRPRVARGTYEDNSWNVTVPLVQAGEISAQRPLEPNYIAALLAKRTIQSILDEPVRPGSAGSLLHALLRHCALRVYVDTAAAILSAHGAAVSRQDLSYETLIKDMELVNLLPGSQPTLTWLRQLEQIIPGVTGNQTLRQYLEGLTQFQTPAVAALGAFRASLQHLQSLDSESLQHLTQGVLDLASHRLDAWITSFATKRLSAIRAAQPQGLYIGGYAWVENLRPATAATVVTPPPEEPGPIFSQPGDPGFIHAPSLAHASTAALLRNAHLGHSGGASADGPFAIDLSSHRVREAEQLLDGIRQGQPLGALLGYRFERRLHEASLDKFIDEFRSLAPLTANRLSLPVQAQESIAAINVVDGWVLHEKWPAEKARLKVQMGADFPAVEREVIALGETIDALSDALTAETAYQLVRGNASRTASTLQAVARGDAPAPELEVARTPRTGVAATHRVVVLLNGAGPAATGISPRAAAEPVLDAWVASLLGDLGKVRCRIERLEDSGDAVTGTHEVRLNELQLSPLDVVFAVEPQARAGTLSELEQRLLYFVRRKPAAGFSESARLRIARGRPADWPVRDLTLDDLLEQARAVRRMLARTRALQPGDLDLPERNTVSKTDVDVLAQRTGKAESALQTTHDALRTLLAKGADADAESLRTAILNAARFGVMGAIPVSSTGDDAVQRTALLTQAAVASKEIQARLDRLTVLRAAPAPGSDANNPKPWLTRLGAVFGESFLAMPQFTFAHSAELARAHSASLELQGGDPLAACSWFTRCERVREPLSLLGAALRGADVLGTGGRMQLSVAQLPFAADDRWAALPLQPGKTLAAGRLSLVIQSTTAVDMKRPVTGLLIDEWVEVVPNKTETTAITFQFNPPDVCAPQTILLAVPPVPGKPWTGWDLQRVLMETLDLAKLRGVDPRGLESVSHYLPALYFGFNAAQAAVSTDFAPLTH